MKLTHFNSIKYLFKYYHVDCGINTGLFNAAIVDKTNMDSNDRSISNKIKEIRKLDPQIRQHPGETSPVVNGRFSSYLTRLVCAVLRPYLTALLTIVNGRILDCTTV